ncbi:MAG: cohesin domain-containing protein [Bacteroidia bacterium]|nr:cohesin domain-containing protein [Bacteroidia bacterium]
MKIIYGFLLIIILLLTCNNVNSQVIITAGTVTSCPGNVSVPVYISDGYGIGAISLVLDYDPAVLTYTGYQDLNQNLNTGMFVINSNGNKVVISWITTTSANFGSTVLLNLNFVTNGGTSPLTWSTNIEGNCELADNNGLPIIVTFTNGAVNSAGQSLILSSNPVNKIVQEGLNTSFSLSVTGATSYQWQSSTDNGLSWADLPYSYPYSGVTDATLYISSLTSLRYNKHCITDGFPYTSDNSGYCLFHYLLCR